MNDDEKVLVGVALAVVAGTLILTGLKLGHALAWDWVWVLAPAWVFGAGVAGVLTHLGVNAIVENRRVRRAKRQYRPTARRYPS